MILTHLLAFIAVPAPALAPAPSLLPMTASAALIGGGRIDPALLPRLKVRAAANAVPVRGD